MIYRPRNTELFLFCKVRCDL